MDIKFAISSNSNFANVTCPLLVNSLLDSGVPPEDIYFFIGGYKHYAQTHTTPNIYKVNHNSFDLTALISVVDLGLKADYWFLLHDTMKAGENFYTKLKSFPIDPSSNTIQLKSGNSSMNVGLYKQSYLDEIKPQLISSEYKNTDYGNPESLQRYKQKAVHKEDVFLRSNKYMSSFIVKHNSIDYYFNNIPRKVIHYPDIDLYKIKANWANKSTYELNL